MATFFNVRLVTPSLESFSRKRTSNDLPFMIYKVYLEDSSPVKQPVRTQLEGAQPLASYYQATAIGRGFNRSIVDPRSASECGNDSTSASGLCTGALCLHDVLQNPEPVPPNARPDKGSLAIRQ